MAARLDVLGPLSPWVQGFTEELRRRGYTSLTIKEQVRLMAKLDAWLVAEGIDSGGLTAEAVDRFVVVRRQGGARKCTSVRGLEPLVGFLRSEGAVPGLPVWVPTTPAELLVDRYRRFLIDERGLLPRSVMQCVLVAEQFLQRRPVAEWGLEDLAAGEVRAFIEVRTRGMAPKTVKHILWSLRSFLKFLFLDGVIAVSLAEAVPAVRGYSLSGLPDPVPLSASRALVDSCDVTTPAGRRDRAVLMLMCRLGLRIGEVARLRIDDLDWRRGEVVVAGKGGRVDRLPLPVDVGEAIVDYLRHGRPEVTIRVVFVAVNAPHGPLTSGAAMNAIVSSASRRAGLARIRPHQLRHGAASQMLAGGSSLREIGQVLRHDHESSTAIYAKIDFGRLAVVVRPWPQVTT